MDRKSFFKSLGIGTVGVVKGEGITVKNKTVEIVPNGKWEQQWRNKKTPEHIQKIADSNRGKKRSAEAKLKMSLAKKGIKQGPMSQITRDRIIEVKLQKGSINKIYQYTLEGSLIAIHNGYNKAAISVLVETNEPITNETKASYASNIYSCIKGRTKHAKGFIWSKKEL